MTKYQLQGGQGGEKTEMEISKKQVGITIALIFICFLLGALFMYGWTINTLNLHGTVGIDMETTSIHCRISYWKDGVLIRDTYHSGNVTNIGDNQTLLE